jgi:hypothetical protein
VASSAWNMVDAQSCIPVNDQSMRPEFLVLMSGLLPRLDSRDSRSLGLSPTVDDTASIPILGLEPKRKANRRQEQSWKT